MANKPRNKMSVSNRAKQFMPFSALSGFKEALEQVEIKKAREEKIELSQSQKERLNNIIKSLILNDEIKVEYYDGNKYQLITGAFKKIDEIYHNIYIGKEIISIELIKEIEVYY
ncbi:MAG: YolD-like family protein [Erysipelotrichia bacterium]|nr:YolD-like family protein [Erysipelotrichia bacterium]